MCTLYLAALLGLNVLFCHCEASNLVVNVNEAGSTDNFTLACNLPLSTNLTRWTYLSGSTGTSLMSYQNGQCTVSPSDSFLNDSIRFSYACNSTLYQVTIHPETYLHNHILACRDVFHPERAGSTWLIKIVQGTPCTSCQQTISFSIMEVTEGYNVTFTCRVSSDVSYVNWNMIGLNTAPMSGLNGQCVTQGTTFLDDTSKYIYSCNKTLYQVTIFNVSRSEHNDMYMCTPFDQAEGTGSNWIIKVKAPVTSVTLKPSVALVNVTENTAMELTCTTSTARPAATVYWYRHPTGNSDDMSQITYNITKSTDYYDLSTTSSLRFVPTRQDNDTNIYCRANNSVNTSPVSSLKTLLNVLYKANDPYIVQGKEYRVIENTPGTLSCGVKGGNPSPTLSWRCNNFSPTIQSTINSNGNVTITFTWTPQRTNEGTCTCTSQQTGFTIKTIDVAVIVLFRPTINMCEWYYNANPTYGIALRNDGIDTLMIMENKSFTLKCSAEGKPTPNVWWNIPKRSLVSSSSVTVNNLTRKMKGDYVLTANTLLEPSFQDKQNVTVNKTISVHVLYPPTIMPMNDIAKLKDKQLNLMCNYTAGMPEKTSIKWTRDIDNREWYNATLNIESLQMSDIGIYTCTASNIMIQSGENKSYIGQHNQSLNLDVLYETVITKFAIDGFTSQVVTINESDPIRLICNADSNPTAVMTLRHESKVLVTTKSNSVEYNINQAGCLDAGIFYCLARNYHNEIHQILRLFVNCHPRAEREVEMFIKSTNNERTHITFKAIAYPPPTLTWFRLVEDNWIIIENEGNFVIQTTDLQSTLIIVNVGKDDFTSYKVIAENKLGLFEQVYVLYPYGIPDTPTELKQIKRHTTSSSIDIEWRPGFNGGQNQTFYIKYKKRSDTTWTYFTVIDREEETMVSSLTGLAENRQYDIVIFASNEIGNSSESPVLIASTKSTSNTHTNLGPLVGSIVGGVTGCVMLVVIVIVIIRRCIFCKVCGKTSNKNSDKTNNSSEEQANYSTGRLEDITLENNDATTYDEIERVTNTDNSAEDSITNNVASVNNYEMVNLNTVESTSYSTLDQTEQRTTSDTANEDNQAVYEEMKI